MDNRSWYHMIKLAFLHRTVKSWSADHIGAEENLYKYWGDLNMVLKYLSIFEYQNSDPTTGEVVGFQERVSGSPT